METHALTRPKSPNDEGVTGLVIRTGLICKWYKEVKSPAYRINRVGKVANLKSLIECWPMMRIPLTGEAIDNATLRCVIRWGAGNKSKS